MTTQGRQGPPGTTTPGCDDCFYVSEAAGQPTECAECAWERVQDADDEGVTT
jgi:hypothetical protein